MSLVEDQSEKGSAQRSNMRTSAITTPHFVLLPFMAQGHQIPMADLAQLLAGHGVMVSLVTTQVNANRLRSTIDHALAAGLPIRLIPLRFPSTELGLPDGCENLDTLPSWDLLPRLLQGAALLRSPLTDYLHEQVRLGHPPTCLVSDAFHPWTREVARDLRVPRLAFHGTCCFSLLCLRKIKESGLFLPVEEEDPSIAKTIPGLAHNIEVSKMQVPGFFRGSNLDAFREDVAESESDADGVVVNSFDDLEPWYIDMYGKAIGRKVWAVGPLSLCKGGDSSRAVRGNKASVDTDRLASWLGSMGIGSVVYASFGSIATTNAPQLMEIGLALEGSGYPFIWVVRTGGNEGTEFEEWLREFEARNKDRCFLIKGWAPQAFILSHPSVGCFVTHCGWNSTLEGLSAGVPMAMWPRFAEQFLNTKLVVEVLGLGVGMELVKEATTWSGDGITLGKIEVQRAVTNVMHGSREGEERRRRAKHMEEAAKKAMDEGGSSYLNLLKMIDQMGNLFHSLNPNVCY